MRFARCCLVIFMVFFTTPALTSVPVCVSASSDDDRDGWGWENQATCLVDENSSGNFSRTRDDRPACQSSASDPDGDGWGWENNQTCDASGSDNNNNNNNNNNSNNNSGKPICQSNSDPDGDGYGWENNASCIVDNNSNTKTTQNNTSYRPADITDLILITGQSNTLGANTAVNANQDSPHARVFAYTDEGWQNAALYQTWDRNSNPGDGKKSSFPDKVHNNLALHFGKQLADKDASRVVGFVLVSEPGEGIAHWDKNAAGMDRVKSKVLTAINELSHKSRIDGILWHQGETDWLLEGTSDPDVSNAPKDYYPKKLKALIKNLRNQSWARSSTPFICGETVSATGVNTHLMALNHDSDSTTACVEGFGLSSRNDGAHFDAAALRTIGARYANRYYEITK